MQEALSSAGKPQLAPSAPVGHVANEGRGEARVDKYIYMYIYICIYIYIYICIYIYIYIYIYMPQLAPSAPVGQ